MTSLAPRPARHRSPSHWSRAPPPGACMRTPSVDAGKKRSRRDLYERGQEVMPATTNLPRRDADEVTAAAGLSRGTPPEGRDPARVALLLISIVVMVGAVTWLRPILKPFLVAVFLYFATKAAAGFLIRLGFPALLAYLTL